MASKLLEKFNARVEKATTAVTGIKRQYEQNHPMKKRMSYRDNLRLANAAQDAVQENRVKNTLPVFYDLADELATAKGWAFKTEHIRDGAEISSTTLTMRSARFDLPQDHYGEDNIFALQINLAFDANGKPDVTAMMTVQKGMDPVFDDFNARPRIKWQDRVTYGVTLKCEEDAVALLEKWTALQSTPDYAEEKSRLKKLQTGTPKHAFQDKPQNMRFGNWA
ncbi:MAG: hypothetical protein HND56_10995 [Pseudomonadota bacterium]|nr:hypothetical protein [Pseudomonadota bacterium]QKK06180.1 MAG: hypothetical protein HND56_10995 [Pseudomonadota bacterium]